MLKKEIVRCQFKDMPMPTPLLLHREHRLTTLPVQTLEFISDSITSPIPPPPPQSKDVEGGPQYRQLLIAGVHRCAVRFPSVAPSVVHLLMDFLGDSSAASALEVVHFVREIAEASPDLRATVMSRLVDTFRQTRSGRVCASSLWVMSEYAATPAEVRGALETLRTSLGDLPLVRGWGGGR